MYTVSRNFLIKFSQYILHKLVYFLLTPIFLYLFQNYVWSQLLKKIMGEWINEVDLEKSKSLKISSFSEFSEFYSSNNSTNSIVKRFKRLGALTRESLSTKTGTSNFLPKIVFHFLPPLFDPPANLHPKSFGSIENRAFPDSSKDQASLTRSSTRISRNDQEKRVRDISSK